MPPKRKEPMSEESWPVEMILGHGLNLSGNRPGVMEWKIKWWNPDNLDNMEDTIEPLQSLGSDHPVFKCYYASIGTLPPHPISQLPPTPEMQRDYPHNFFTVPTSPSIDSLNSLPPPVDNNTPVTTSKKTIRRRQAKKNKVERSKAIQEKKYRQSNPHSGKTVYQCLYVTKDGPRLQRFQDLEKKNAGRQGGLVNRQEAEELGIKFVTSGLTLLFDSGSREYIGMINFRDINQISQDDRLATQQSMSTMVNILNTNYNINNNNGASTQGRMAGWGLKQSFRGNGYGIDTYSPKPGMLSSFNHIAANGVESLGRYLMARFESTWKSGYDEQVAMAKDKSIPSFTAATMSIDEWKDSPGPNSLTITDNGFYNVQHKDKDMSTFTFGVFWNGYIKNGKPLGMPLNVGHAVEGGEFVWAEYGIGAGIPAEDNVYAEIAWRGKSDFHGTLACKSLDGFKTANRYGCSVQITKKGAGKFIKAMEGGSISAGQVYQSGS